MLLAKAGIHSRLERPPAICFLDITGYPRLTQERGDEAAADLALAGLPPAHVGLHSWPVLFQ
ncbi:hypothetical protein [Intrasporangium sp.]|uniref:hypothetical protein n=1 Tax=Intrasporangium sp. TaxID=1925024 RepID=UPI002B46C83B|nr:hypothetical protein [Intrasporangium sp.]